MTEEFTQKLAELEEQTRLEFAKVASRKARCLLLVNNAGKLDEALNWLQSHGLSFTEASVVVKAEGLTSPVVIKLAQLTSPVVEELTSPLVEELKSPSPAVLKSEVSSPPPILQSVLCSLKRSAAFPAATLYAIPPLELTTSVVSLLHSAVDLVFIVGCRALSRGQYENVAEFTPLIEEIILKEAIQPVILYK